MSILDKTIGHSNCFRCYSCSSCAEMVGYVSTFYLIFLLCSVHALQAIDCWLFPWKCDFSALKSEIDILFCVFGLDQTHAARAS